MENLVEPDRIPKDFMGIVRADLFLENSEDRTRFEYGYISDDEIRSTTVNGIVDTGARMLFLPADVVEHLGLTTRRFTRVRYTDGRQEEVPMAGPSRSRSRGARWNQTVSSGLQKGKC